MWFDSWIWSCFGGNLRRAFYRNVFSSLTLSCSLDAFVFAFLYLENWTSWLRRSQRPFVVITIAAAFGQGVAVTSRLEIEAIDKFLLRLHVNLSEDYFAEAICDCFDSIPARQNSRDEVAVLISSRFLNGLRAFSDERHKRARKRVPPVVANGSADGSEWFIGACGKYVTGDKRHQRDQRQYKAKCSSHAKTSATKFIWKLWTGQTGSGEETLPEPETAHHFLPRPNGCQVNGRKNGQFAAAFRAC